MSFSSKVIATYHGRLADHLDSTRQMSDAIGWELVDAGRQMCNVLEPLFLDGSVYDAIQRDASLVVRGLTDAVRYAVRDAALGALIGLHARHAELLQRDTLSPVLCGRLDCIIGAQGHKFIEYNPISPDTTPSGLGEIDQLYRAFVGAPIMSELRARYRFREESVLEATFDAFQRLQHGLGREGAPSIAVIGVPLAPSKAGASGGGEEILTAQRMRTIAYLIERGCAFSMCASADLEYRDGELRERGGARIDVTFIAGDPHYLDTCNPESPFLRAIRDGAVATADGYPMGGLVGHKALFAYLTDPASVVPLAEDVADAVARVLPWTRRMRKGSETTFRGEKIALDAFVRANRDILVLKPVEGLGGKGVALGWECDERAWDDAVAAAFAATDFIVQERVRGETRSLAKMVDGKVAHVPHHFGIDPFVWADGQARGAYVRISESERLNISTGATLASALVVDGEIAER